MWQRGRARPAPRWPTFSPGRKPPLAALPIARQCADVTPYDRGLPSPDPLALALRSVMRLPARLMIAALALTVAGSIGGCSAGAGLAYAGDSSRPPAGVVAAGSAAAAAASARPTAAPGPPSAPAGPRIVVTGAPRGVKAKAGILADATTGQVLWSSGGNTER